MGLIGDLFTPSQRAGSTTMNINNERMTEIVTEVLKKNESQMNVEVVVDQEINIGDSSFKGCAFKSTNYADLEVKIIQSVKTGGSTVIKNDIAEKMKQALENESKKENGFLSSEGGPSGDVITNVSDKVSVAISDSITDESLNEMIMAVDIRQVQNIENIVVDNTVSIPPILLENLDPAGKLAMMEIILEKNAEAAAIPCPIGNELILVLLAQQMVENITDVVTETNALSELDQYAKVSSDTLVEGVGGTVAKAAEGIGTGVGTAAEGVGTGVGTAAKGVGEGFSKAQSGLIAVAVILIIGVGVFMYIKSKKKIK